MPSRQEWRKKGADMTIVMLAYDPLILRQGLRSQADLIHMLSGMAFCPWKIG